MRLWQTFCNREGVNLSMPAPIYDLSGHFSFFLGGGLHSILKCHDTFQKKERNKGNKGLHFLKGL